ncbi:1736_t:CDS:2, partial [Cetraspora pellucida]
MSRNSVLLLAKGLICPELHYSSYAHDWWSPRLSNDKDISVSVPYQLYMHISFVLNQRQFFIRVIKSEENQLQSGFICISSNKTSKVCLTPSQAVNSVYHVIFGKKTVYSGPAILGFNDENIVQKLLNEIIFRLIFISVGNFIVVVSEIGNKSFTSSILTKKSQKILALQKMINDIFTLNFYKREQILWHYEDKSANSVWAQVGITMHLDVVESKVKTKLCVETITEIFKHNYWQWPIAGSLAGYIVAHYLPHFRTPAHFSPAAITSLCNEELHHPKPKVSTHTELQSNWTIALPKPQDKENIKYITYINIHANF